jgi:hypothetical protein
MTTTLQQLDELSYSSLKHFAFYSVSGLFIGTLAATLLTRHRFNIGLYFAGIGGGFSLTQTWRTVGPLPYAGTAEDERKGYVAALHELVQVMDECPADAGSVLSYKAATRTPRPS